VFLAGEKMMSDGGDHNLIEQAKKRLDDARGRADREERMRLREEAAELLRRANDRPRA
jgi:hypothetical protein